MNPTSQLLKRIKNQFDVEIVDHRGMGRGFAVINQPFKKIKLQHDAANGFFIRIDYTNPQNLKLTVEDAEVLRIELMQAIDIVRVLKTI